jgi:hypothetical protein
VFESRRARHLIRTNGIAKTTIRPTPVRRKQMVGRPENGKTCHFLAFLGLFVEFYRAFVRRKLNCHENVTPTHEGCRVVRIANNLSRIGDSLWAQISQIPVSGELRGCRPLVKNRRILYALANGEASLAECWGRSSGDSVTLGQLADSVRYRGKVMRRTKAWK